MLPLLLRPYLRMKLADPLAVIFSVAARRRLRRGAAERRCRRGGEAEDRGQTDLPRFSYPSPAARRSSSIADAATFDPFAAKVRADIDGTLAATTSQTARPFAGCCRPARPAGARRRLPGGVQTAEPCTRSRKSRRPPARRLYGRSRLQAAIDAGGAAARPRAGLSQALCGPVVDLPWAVGATASRRVTRQALLTSRARRSATSSTSSTPRSPSRAR